MLKDSEQAQLTSVSATFEDDIIKGLASDRKYLPSKYFYDERGDQLFREIMNLDEYYLTGSEYEIFKLHTEKLFKFFNENNQAFRLIELGAGDGYKTKILLEYFLQKKANFTYCPIDISAHSLSDLTADLETNMPGLSVKPVHGEYLKALDKVKDQNRVRNILLFLGSNIGNFTKKQAKEFLSKLALRLTENDLLLIGFDLKKDPEVILRAYNDRKGITREFNLNLLRRINKELYGNFDLEKFRHFPTYDPVSGETKSYLISLENQQVHLNKADLTIKFRKWEPIFMEVSHKYNLNDIEELAQVANFRVKEHFFDQKEYFTDSLWEL